jgi:hypothetical protein
LRSFGVNNLCWLVFKRGCDLSVVIQPAGGIITTRMRALLAGIESEFQEGHKLDAKIAKKVPKKMIGHALSFKEGTALLKKLR